MLRFILDHRNFVDLDIALFLLKIALLIFFHKIQRFFQAVSFRLMSVFSEVFANYLAFDFDDLSLANGALLVECLRIK